MSLKEAKLYIERLHKRQENPFLWPDYLTGLPDKAAIIKKISSAYERGRDCIFYLRIANIEPYLIKYGADRHAELIQWAAAILKTTAKKYRAFVGVFSSHDFITICPKNHADGFIKEALGLFTKKALTFYSPDDLKEGKVLSFEEEGRTVSVGLMKFIYSTLCGKTNIPKEQLIRHLANICDEIEKKER